jgi:hypothetical protein
MIFGLSKKDITYIVISAIVGFIIKDIYDAMKQKATQ